MATQSSSKQTNSGANMSKGDIFKAGYLDVECARHIGLIKWTGKKKRRRCTLTRQGKDSLLAIYEHDEVTTKCEVALCDIDKTSTSPVSEDLATCTVQRKKGIRFSVMYGSADVINDWVDSINTAIDAATGDKPIHKDSPPVEETPPPGSQTLPKNGKKNPEGSPSKKRRKMQTRVLKEGCLNMFTGFTDQWDNANFNRRYCKLQRGNRLSLKVYDSDNEAGTSQTLLLDTALKAVKCSTCCEVVNMDGEMLCSIYVTDDAMADWIVSLNKAIMDARCQGQTGNSESYGDDSDDSSLEQGLGALSLGDAEQTKFLRTWFPDLDTQSYIIPRVHYSTVEVKTDVVIGGHNVQTLKAKEEIKKLPELLIIDNIRKRVHFTMNTIIEKIKASDEVMVIMTEVKNSMYTSRNTDMKRDLDDLLVIHRDRGLLLGAVIGNRGPHPQPVWEEINHAIDYLDKADDILPEVARRPEVAVNKTIILPNVSRALLKNVIRSLQDKERERLERCVGVQAGYDVASLCLTKDDMVDKDDKKVEERLKEWWTACLKRDTQGDTQGDTAMMGEEVYRVLVAKFAKSLTTVEMSQSTKPRLQLWTKGHVVHAVGEEHGSDLTRIALSSVQVDLLDNTLCDGDDIMILHGGPGTAKTMVLLLRGVSWSRDGCDRVFNIQTRPDGQAAAYLVSHQLREIVARPDFTVQHVNMVDWWDENNKDWTEEGRQKVTTWCDKAASSKDRKVHIIADEACGQTISHMYKELNERHCIVKLWAAGVKLKIPDYMKCYVKKMTTPLRCPPSVIREVMQAKGIQDGTVPPYTKPPVAPPCDGPPVITITHYEKDYSWNREGHQAEGDHDAPWRCEECGRRVAHLLHTLHIGRHDNGPGEQGGLRYNDVFIMGVVIDGRPDTPDDDDDDNSPAPFIRGLRQLGIPTRVVHDEDSEAVKRVAENSWPAEEDAVTIVHETTVWGLERKVVVYLDRGDGTANDNGRLVAISRSTAQVVWVKP